MDVVDDAALLLDGPPDWLGVRCGCLESFAKFFLGLLQAFPMAAVVAAEFAGDEAEDRGEHHPQRQEGC